MERRAARYSMGRLALACRTRSKRDNGAAGAPNVTALNQKSYNKHPALRARQRVCSAVLTSPAAFPVPSGTKISPCVKPVLQR